jgi:hypothetical protein
MSDNMVDTMAEEIATEVQSETAKQEEQAPQKTSPFDSDPIGITIEGTRYELTKMRARQVATISNIFGEMLIAGDKKLKDFKVSGDINFIVGVLAALDERSLIRLGAALIGKDEKFVEDNFDLVWVTEALGKQLKISNLRGVLINFTSISTQIQ